MTERLKAKEDTEVNRDNQKGRVGCAHHLTVVGAHPTIS